MLLNTVIETVKEKVVIILCSTCYAHFIVDKCIDLMEKENISKEVALNSLGLSLSSKCRNKILNLINEETWSSK